jgi:threonine/homoserine/homoserine lactone efflux protein
MMPGVEALPTPTTFLAFGLIALGMVCSPGPNMIYLVSRSIAQGRRAGMVSLLGVATGFLAYLLLTCLGLAAVFAVVPAAYTALKWAGAAYLLWLAWQAIRPGAKPLFAPKELPPDSARRLFAMGLLTNLLNPKIAVLYVSLLPQFVDPACGPVLAQSLALGFTQIAVSLTVNTCIVFGAGALSSWLAGRPIWLRLQSWFMATVLGALAVRLATERARP